MNSPITKKMGAEIGAKMYGLGVLTETRPAIFREGPPVKSEP
jgi:hypothetical protein